MKMNNNGGYYFLKRFNELIESDFWHVTSLYMC